MALTYRSPLEENVAAYDSSVQAVIASTSANYYRDVESSNFQFFNFALSPVAKKKLIEAGIYLSPYSAIPHSHPACKTLENNILYNVLPNLVNNTFYFVGIKNFKLDLLKLRNSKLSVLNKICRYVTSLDRVRYGNEFVVRSTEPIPGLIRHGGSLECPTLKDLVPETLKKGAKNLFFHDELHYWSHRDLIAFLEVVRPEVVYATIVFPPELLQGATQSLNKWCYTFEVVGKDLIFYPDGVRSEGYQQPLHGGYLLRTKTITLPDGSTYMVDVVNSKFAHHLVAITKGVGIGPTIRAFGPFEATSCRGLEPLVRNVQHCFPVAFEVVSRVYRYLRTLKKPDPQSAMAKLSQLLPEPTGIEIKFLQDFASLVIDTKTVSTMIKPARVKLFLGSWLKKMPNVVVSRLNIVKEISLDEFVSYMEPYTFHIKLEEVSWNYTQPLDLFSMAEADYGIDMVGLLEDKFEMGITKALAERTECTYTGMAALVDRRCNGVSIPKESVERMCYKILVDEMFDPFMRKLSLLAIRQLLVGKVVHSWGLLVPKDRLAKLISSPEFLIKLVRRAKTMYIKELVMDFASYPLLWFLDPRRGYRRFITSYSEGATLIKPVAAVYRQVVHAAVTFDRSRLLRRMVPVAYYRCTNEWKSATVPEPPESASAPDQAQTETTHLHAQAINDELGGAAIKESVVCGQLKCACCIDLQVKTIPLDTMHNFKVREVLNGRSAGWYSKTGIDYTYNGGAHISLGWPDWLPEWMGINEIDDGYYNCCLYQEYEKNGKIGFHADNEEIFEPGCSILTVNLTGSAIFSIMCSKGTGSVDLKPGTYFIMPEGFQESHKHSVCQASKGRSSLTFRKLKRGEQGTGASKFDRPEVGDADATLNIVKPEPKISGVESECTKGEGQSTQSSSSDSEAHEIYGCLKYSEYPADMQYKLMNVKGDGNCFWRVLEKATGLTWTEIKRMASRYPPTDATYQERFFQQMANGVFAESESMLAAAYALHARIHILDVDSAKLVTILPSREVTREVHMHLSAEHFQLLKPLNDCVLQAVANAVKRDYCEVLAVYSENIAGMESMCELWRAGGVKLEDLDSIFSLFDIEACVFCDGKSHVFNAGGCFKASFELAEGHLEYIKINPSVDNVVLRGSIETLSVSPASICELRAQGSTLPYVARKRRAAVLASSFLSGCTGVLNSKLFNNEESMLHKMVHENELLPTEVITLLGTFGAGKSSIFAKFFDRNRAKGVFYVSPRKALAAEFSDKIGLSIKMKGHRGAKRRATAEVISQKAASKNWHVCTFEVMLKKLHLVKPGMAVLVDEIQLYPPGYLDLILYCLPDGVQVIVGGDPCQSNYDNEQDRALLINEEQDVVRLLAGQDYKFNILSKRFKNKNLQGRLPCQMDMMEDTELLDEEHLLYTGLEELSLVPKEFRGCFLVSSFEEKKIVEAYIEDESKAVLTFGESTGLNFQRGVILITNVSNLADDKRWVTALSRFSVNVCLVNLVGTSWEFICKSYKGRPLGQFLSKKATPEDLVSYLPGNPGFTLGFTSSVGRDEGLKEDKAVGDPWLKGMIDLFQIEDVEEVEEQLEEIQEEWFKTHLPIAELESVRAGWVHKILAKEFREVRMGYNVSEQFTDEYAKEQGKVLTNAAERFETIYPRHRANDTVTFLMAVKKRLRFSRPATEKAKLVEAQAYGGFLLNQFLKKVPLKRAHNKVMMESAKAEFEEKKMSKSAATIENHSGRSCRDWLLDIGQIFSKSQLCTKFDNRFRVAKAAQSIVCFQHEVLCRFAPYMRYIEKKLHEVLPENYYIHSGKGLDELCDWVKKGKFDGVCTESDYEAFDASQDQYIVAFEIAVMQYLGLPRDLIEDYKFIKTHLGSKLGNFAIMRFSGEASTFLFNTMANMLFTFLRYDIKGKEYICFAGDDMCASERLAVKTEHEGFLKKLKLKAKVFMVEKPTFCGWHLSPDGIYKKPQLVLERMCIAKEKANLADCIDNYAIEVSFAYRMGERALNRMDEEEAAAFYNCVRIIIKNKHLLKSNIKDLYTGLDELA